MRFDPYYSTIVPVRRDRGPEVSLASFKPRGSCSSPAPGAFQHAGRRRAPAACAVLYIDARPAPCFRDLPGVL
jgi:hypothetical protein